MKTIQFLGKGNKFPFLLAIFLLAICMAGCSKGTDSPNPKPNPTKEKDQLELKASANKVAINQEVTFTVTAKSKAVTDAVLFVNEKAISGMKHRFDKKGTYSIVAQRNGYKNSDAQTITVAEGSISISATRVTTTPREPSLGQEYLMCYGNGKFYTFDRAHDKFMSYDMATKAWTFLSHTINDLIYAGNTSKMLYLPPAKVIYFNGKYKLYYTWEYNNISLKNTWHIYTINDAFQTGESAYAISGDDIYCAGGRTSTGNASSDIRKYSVSSSWRVVGKTGFDMKWGDAVMVGKKMYMIGEGLDKTIRGAIFDTEQLTYPEIWSLPSGLDRVFYNHYQMALYKGNIFVGGLYNNIQVYNIKSKKWFGTKIQGDYLSSYFPNFFVNGDQFYAAGQKNGNFALYTLNIKFPAGW